MVPARWRDQDLYARWICTNGFAADWGPLAWAVLLTASHCSSNTWAIDGATVYQPTVSAANDIGSEIYDPPAWACGLNTCRWSDETVVSSTNHNALGDLLTTTSAATNSWGTITTGHPHNSSPI